MKIGIYPGSFNPWHEGHEDILKKALQVFDQVVVAEGINPEKTLPQDFRRTLEGIISNNFEFEIHHKEVVVESFSGLLVDFVKEQKGSAIIRGLRNGHDLQYEMNQQYWNEDLSKERGLETIPTIYFICDRSLSHISSSAIRALHKVRGEEK